MAAVPIGDENLVKHEDVVDGKSVDAEACLGDDDAEEGRWQLGVKLTRGQIIYASYSVFTMLIVFLLAQYDKFIISYFSSSLKEDIPLTESQYGLVVGYATGLVYAVFAIPLGYVVERWHLKRVWVVAAGCAIWSACVIIQGCATSFVMLFLARMGMGLGQAASETLTLSLNSDFVIPEWVSVSQSVFYSAIYFGQLISSNVAYAFNVHGISWRWSFIGVGIAGIVIALIVAVTVREPERGKYLIKGKGYHTKTKWHMRKTIRYLVSLRTWWAIVLASGVREVGGYTFGYYMPGYLMALYPSKPNLISIYGIIVAVFGTTAMLAGGAITALYYRRRPGMPAWITGVGGMIASVFLLLMVFSLDIAGGNEDSGFILLWVFMALEYLFAEAFLGPIVALQALLLPPSLRTFAFCVFQSIVTFMGSSGPEIMGLALQGSGVAIGSPEWVSVSRMLLAIVIPASYWIAGILFVFVALRVRPDVSAREAFVRLGQPATVSGARRMAFIIGGAMLVSAVLALFVTSLVLHT